MGRSQLLQKKNAFHFSRMRSLLLPETRIPSTPCTPSAPLRGQRSLPGTESRRSRRRRVDTPLAGTPPRRKRPPGSGARECTASCSRPPLGSSSPLRSAQDLARRPGTCGRTGRAWAPTIRRGRRSPARTSPARTILAGSSYPAGTGRSRRRPADSRTQRRRRPPPRPAPLV